MKVSDLENALNNIYQISDKSQQTEFIAWILDISDSEFVRGKDFLMQHNASFKILWELLSHLSVYTVVLEDHYVDRVYRDSYYFYYSAKHFNYSRFCKRLCIFDGILENVFSEYSDEELQEMFIGSIVIRPIPNRSIGRTLLNPKYFLDEGTECWYRLAKYNVTVYGKKLTVKAFPYEMQDGETTSCAETTILNMLDYYSQSYPEYHYLLPSEISKLAQRNSYERIMPTIGLSYELISRIFCDAGFYPRLYAAVKMEKVKFWHILNYYIESGIPVALGLKIGEESKHSIIVLGHTVPDDSRLGKVITCAYDPLSGRVSWICDFSDMVDTYCIMDDNEAPYSIRDCIVKTEGDHHESVLRLNGAEIEYMMVPLYKRMILEAADASDICFSILSDEKIGINDNLFSDYVIDTEKQMGTKEDPWVVRLFMASSRTFRNIRDKQFGKDNREVRDLYNITVFPKFIWICEITTQKLFSEEKVVGEIIIDATSSADAKMDSFIMIHYPGVVYRRMPEDSVERGEIYQYNLKTWSPFERFCGNLRKYP